MAQSRSSSLKFLLDKHNREVLSWLAGGLSTALVGGWAVFTYLYSPISFSRSDVGPPEQVGMQFNDAKIEGGQFSVQTGFAPEQFQMLWALIRDLNVDHRDAEAATRLVELAKRQVQAVRLIDAGKPEAALQQVMDADSELSALNGHASDDAIRLLRGYFYKTAAQAAARAGDESAARDHAQEAARIFESIETDAGTGRISREALAGAINGLGNVQAEVGDYRAAIASYRRATNLVPTYAYAWHDMLLAQLTLAKQGEVDVKAIQHALGRLMATAPGYPGLDADRIAKLAGAVDAYSTWTSRTPTSLQRAQ